MKHFRRLVSSVGRAPVCCAGGLGLKPQTGSTLMGLKITEENVLPLSANGSTFKSSRIRTINRQYPASSVLHGQRTHTLVEKSRGR